MLKTFLKYCLFFFLPIVLVIIGMEILVKTMPNPYRFNAQLLEQKSNSLEVLVVGSSQMMSAVNPAWLDVPTINLASGNQHHDTDFKLLKQLLPKLSNIQTVVLELSYSHLELPHNGPEFWKNNFYLKYYGVNCFERPTYFKDKMLFLSNPPLLSERLYAYYIQQKNLSNYNAFGFNRNDDYGQFALRNYNPSIIDTLNSFKINTAPNTLIFQHNAEVFFEILDYLEDKNIQVIIVTLPMYPTYLKKKNPTILKRRDSILQLAHKKYPSVSLFLKETDTIPYSIKDFYNQSHLSLQGAKKFTQALNETLLKN